MPLSRSLLTATVAASVAGSALMGATAGSATPAPTRPLPTHDAFYRYSGHTPLADIKPGTVLKKRSVTIYLGKNASPLNGEQLLYRTRDELKRPSVTVTTVIAPDPASNYVGIEGYLSFYDALGPVCEPSYTLAGGYAGSPSNQAQANLEETLIAADLAQGVAVTVPDFEGERQDWGAGQEAGWSTLDSIRATESYLGAPRSTKVGLSGYSGGSIAAEWAAELQPRYAPAINLVGVVAGGVPVDMAHNLHYVNGTVSWSGVIPAVTVAVGRAFDVPLQKYLSAYGKKVKRQVAGKCIGGFLGKYPHLRIQQLLKPKYHDVFSIRAFRHVVNHMIMGSAPGHPTAPIFLGVGNSDGTGDGVMVSGDVEALAHEYCKQGVTVKFATYWGSDHQDAAVRFEPVASAWLLDRFDGAPASGNCASIGTGNSLAPVKAPRHHTADRHRTGWRARATGRPLPTHDPFYRYAGSTPLRDVRPGAVLKKRMVQVSLGTDPTPMNATQLLYRTTSELGRPEVTVTTVLASPVASATHYLVGYLSFYDGFGPQCDPSYTLAGGYAGNSTNEQEAELEELLIAHYLAAGLDVTIPDFEGERRDWGAGREAGRSSLDAIRATESALGLPRSTEVALSGYSGGSIAADWASELAPRYAAKVDLVGVAEGGIPVDYVHNLAYVARSAQYAGTIPAVLVGVARGFHIRLARYLAPAGKRAARLVRGSCIQSFLDRFPHLTLRKMLKPRYQPVAAVRSLRVALNRTIMGRAPGHPRAPLFMGIGDQDGTGDGVMIRGDVEALAHEYCHQGVAVKLGVYQGAGHEPAAAEFEPEVTAWLLQRFAGVPASGNCASIGTGNSLAPLKAPKR